MTIRVPQRGQVVYLDGTASAQFDKRPIKLLLTSPVEPSTLDAAHHRGVDDAARWLLTGWQLDAHGIRLIHRTVAVLAAGVQATSGSAVA